MAEPKLTECEIYNKWRKREELLLAIPKQDASLLMNMSSFKHSEVDLEDPTIMLVAMEDVANILMAVRRRVILEAVLWVGVFVAVTVSVVSAFVLMR